MLVTGEYILRRILLDLVGSHQPTKSDGIPSNGPTIGHDGKNQLS